MNNISVDDIAKRLDELNAQSIMVLNTSGKTIICDHMIICTVNSTRQMRFIGNSLLKEHGLKRKYTEENDNESWHLVDLGNVIVHIMTADARVEIDLESIWSDKK